MAPSAILLKHYGTDIRGFPIVILKKVEVKHDLNL